jgi:exosome complex component CSL4
MASAAIAVPGQLLGSVSDYLPGPGTHIFNEKLFASVLGPINIQDGKTKKLPTISISHDINSTPETSNSANLLPSVSSTVLARVTRIQPNLCTVEILLLNDSLLPTPFSGLIRPADIRATEKDKIKIASSFRPGDIIRAQVISLGDSSSYYLSTARNDLGVIMANSEAGNQMFPVSWKEFRDPVTGVGEQRKVAKPF